MKRWWALLPLVLVAGLAAIGWFSLRETAQAPADRVFDSPERPAPDHAFARLDGAGTVALHNFGKPVLVNFWASWCTPCRAEHPLLLQLEEAGVEVVGVLYKDQAEAGRGVLAADGNPFADVILDPNGDGAIAFGVSGVPETFLVDAHGRIVKSHRGPLGADAATEMLAHYRALIADNSVNPEG